jgi:hypothetical protein
MTVARRPCIAFGMRHGASHEVCGSCSTVQRVESTAASITRCSPPGVTFPVRSVLRVSHPLDGLLLDSLPGLVSCRSALGVPRPSELFPRPEPWRLSVPCCLHVIHHHRRVGRRLRRGTAVPVALSPEQAGSECDFKALLPGASPLRWPRTVRPAARPMLSWASGPFRVLPPDRVLVCFHRAPPSSFRSVRLGLAPCTDFTGSPESLPGRDWPCSAQHGRPSWGFPPRR